MRTQTRSLKYQIVTLNFVATAASLGAIGALVSCGSGGPTDRVGAPPVECTLPDHAPGSGFTKICDPKDTKPREKGDQVNWEQPGSGDSADASHTKAAGVSAELEKASASDLSDSASAGGATGRDGDYGGQRPVGAGILTAGSFDDGLNLDIFLKYFAASPLAQIQDSVLNLWKTDWPSASPAQKRTSPETQPQSQLEISFIVDTTGSMGDELEWLKKDFESIAQQIASKYANLTPRYSLVVYRDSQDTYVTRGFGFTENVATLAEQIAQQSADGGGDFPEALDRALSEAASKLQWSANSYKLAFVIADAPPHAQQYSIAFEAINQLKSQGIRLFPVAASGIDDMTEAIFRTAALVTGGHYIFLTDDSGVGNSHAEPHFPCYHVERLSHAVMRSIATTIAGSPIEPAPHHIIRTVGQPAGGRCLVPNVP